MLLEIELTKPQACQPWVIHTLDEGEIGNDWTEEWLWVELLARG